MSHFKEEILKHEGVRDYVFEGSPVRNELVQAGRLKTVAAQDVRAYLAALLDNTDRNLLPGLLLQLLKTNRR